MRSDPENKREPETAHSILANAFGDTYLTWNNIASDKIVLNEEEKKQLSGLIQERDHYEIKRTVAKLRQPGIAGKGP